MKATEAQKMLLSEAVSAFNTGTICLQILLINQTCSKRGGKKEKKGTEEEKEGESKESNRGMGNIQRPREAARGRPEW